MGVHDHRRLVLLVLASAMLSVLPARAENASAIRPGQPQARSAVAISDQDLRAAAAAMDEGRAALRRANFAGAIGLFSKVLKFADNQYSAEALELLGVAHQKNGEIADARATYEDYLRRYPSGEQSERVSQRLAGIVTAVGDPAQMLHTPDGRALGALPTGKFTQTHETTSTLVGNISSFYIRDDSFATARDRSLAPDPTADVDAHAVHQNEVLTTLDLMATWNNDDTKGRIRFSGGEEHRFNSDQGAYQIDETGVSAASLDMLAKDWNLRTVAGRQTYNADGILGRFDGAFFSWQPLPLLKVDLFGGSPASSRYDLPFKNERYFYGAAIGTGPVLGGVEASVYATEQRDRWLVDREAFGTDLRYLDLNKFVFATIDDDVRFQKLNAAIFSGSWTLPDTSTIYGGADFRRTPYLSTWNAVINQPFGTIYDLLRAQQMTNQQLDQLAYDQTPVYRSMMFGYTRPLTDKWQVAADATLVNLSQPIAPIGLDPTLATLAAGNEYYLSAQLIGNNIVKDGDTYIGAFRYARQETDTTYILDFNSRYPVTADFTVGPRLRLGYSLFSGTDLIQYTLLPSVLIDYRWDKNLTFEAEIGTQWTIGVQPGQKTSDTELFATLGVRYTFDIEGGTGSANDKSKLPAPVAAALCRYSPRADGSNCASPTAVSP